MEQQDPDFIVQIRATFERWRQDPINRFVVRLRRHRADELQRLLADPAQVDLPMFNRDVWALETETLVRPEGTPLHIFAAEVPDAATVAEAESALDSGKLELHGNYVWRSASGIYAPHLKDDHQKLENIQRALRLLNDGDLTPPAKAQKIEAIYGFGPNTATGLVMLFHPDQFAIRNVQSTDALDKLGIAAEPPEVLQASVRNLRSQLGAEDFLELDWFLYLVAQGKVPVGTPTTCRYWWVNQGTTYKAESTGGYIWAPKQGKGGRTFEHWTNLTRVRKGDVVLHYANGAVRALGRVLRTAREAPRPVEAGDGPWQEQGYLVGVDYREFSAPIALASIPADWRTADIGPFTQQGDVKQGYLFPVAEEFVNRLVERFSLQLPDGTSSEGPPPLEEGVWLFQANPAIYNLVEELGSKRVGDEDDWSATRYRQQMRPGDAVLLWQGGPNAGIYAVGELTGEPFQRPTGTFWPDQDQRPPTEWAIPFRYTRILDEPIEKTDLQRHPILQNLQVLRAPQGTNFKVAPEEWVALRELLDEPANRRYWKIAPGEGGKRWEEFRSRGMIAIGWTGSPDLRSLEIGSKQDLHHRLEALPEMQEQNYKFHHAADQLWSFFREMTPGDWVCAYSAGRVYGRGEITGDYRYEVDEAGYPHRRAVEWRSTNPLDASNLTLTLRGKLQQNTTIVELTETDFAEINLTSEPKPPTIGDLARLTYLDPTDLEEIEALLKEKKQLVFEGPPGSGKTYVAKLFARYFTGAPLHGAADERVEVVQFHQSYGYEDFVQGIRPVTDDQGRLQYHVLPGTFMRLCDLAARNPTERFVLVVDEINRGNLSRIFGELLLLLEYRNERVRLPYGAVEGKTEQAYLTIPENLYLIGTMNSTDRSLALIDYALRRRFYFYRFLPVVDGRAQVLEGWLAEQKMPDAEQQRVLRLFIELNHRVQQNLTPDFQIGHSYFMRDDIGTEEGVDRLWRRSLRPLLTEYFHNHRDPETILAEFEPDRLLGEAQPGIDAATADEV